MRDLSLILSVCLIRLLPRLPRPGPAVQARALLECELKFAAELPLLLHHSAASAVWLSKVEQSDDFPRHATTACWGGGLTRGHVNRT